MLIGARRLVVAAVALVFTPSWNSGPAKQAILAFVAEVTQEGGPGFVSPAERIATFDNDASGIDEQESPSGIPA